jgi:transcriptional regulator with XRE-family HTH domain
MHTLTVIIGERLRRARKAAGFKTAREFAVANAISQSTYSQYETGKRAFNAEALVRLCRALQVNADWLLFGPAGSFLPSDTIRGQISSPKETYSGTSLSPQQRGHAMSL